MRRSIVLISDIAKGEKINSYNLDFRRPGTGLEPKKLKKIVGRRAKRKLLRGKIIKFKDIN